MPWCFLSALANIRIWALCSFVMLWSSSLLPQLLKPVLRASLRCTSVGGAVAVASARFESLLHDTLLHGSATSHAIVLGSPQGLRLLMPAPAEEVHKVIKSTWTIHMTAGACGASLC